MLFGVIHKDQEATRALGALTLGTLALGELFLGTLGNLGALALRLYLGLLCFKSNPTIFHELVLCFP